MFETKLVQIGPKTTVKALYECLLLVFTGGFSLCPPFFCPFGKTQDLKRMWQIAKTHSVFNRIESRELRRSLGAVSCSAQFTALSCPMCFTWTVLTFKNKLSVLSRTGWHTDCPAGLKLGQYIAQDLPKYMF